jgi:hypothetical protein
MRASHAKAMAATATITAQNMGGCVVAFVLFLFLFVFN